MDTASPVSLTKKPPVNKASKPRKASFQDAVIEFGAQRKRNRGLPPVESMDVYNDLVETKKIMPKRKGKKDDTTPSNLKIPREVVRDEVTGDELDPNGVPYLDGNAKKTNVRKRTTEESLIINQRIEQCRGLLALSMSVDDIRRTVSPAWGIAPKSVNRYLVLARKRQQKILNRKPEELKADSLTYWSRKLQDAEQRKTRGVREMEKAIEFEIKAKEMLNKAGDDSEQIRLASEVLHTSSRMKEHARKTIQAGEIQAQAVQDRIDRLVGNYAPERIALVTTEGKDVLQSAPEPLSRAGMKTQLYETMKAALAELKPEERLLIESRLLSEKDVPSMSFPLEVVEDEE